MRAPLSLRLGILVVVASCSGAEALHQRDGGTGADHPAGNGGAPGLGGSSGGQGGVVGAGGGSGGNIGSGGNSGGAGGNTGAGGGSGGSGGSVGVGGSGGGGAGGGRGGAGGSGMGGGMGGQGGVPCSPGGAVQFDGINDYLSVARQVQDDFTIEGWIKTTATSLTGTNFWEGNGLFYADVMGVGNDFGVSVLGNKIVFGVGNVGRVLSASNVNTGAWVHVALVRTRTTGAATVLINGITEMTMTSAMTAALTAPTTITIGGNTIDQRYFSGVIDELRIWNVARTEAQIRSTMNQLLTGTEAGLVGYWRFDETSGTTYADRSPSANTATAAAGNDAGPSAPGHVTSDAPLCQ